ncbi:hypothetical protein ACW0JT_00175 [Arthrobacter sp. SA17]
MENATATNTAVLNHPSSPASAIESSNAIAENTHGANIGAPDSAGSYSYSDDDWGPPRDEDAPPLDDEPPMDWEPPAEPGQHLPVRQPAASADTKPMRGQSTPSKAPAAGHDPASEVKGPATSDPWAHAREQAPGVWVIAAESNVGSRNGSADSPVSSAAASLPTPATAAAAAAATNVPAESPAPTPRYEPAAAQVPQPVGAMAGPGGASATSAAPASVPAKKPATTSSQAPSKSTPSAYTVSAATSPGEAAVRQSLYQRLSSSPEAEAGRAKAPARTADTGAAFIQDVPSADDETIEESGVFGRAAVERILGGKLLEERSLDGSPLPTRF